MAVKKFELAQLALILWCSTQGWLLTHAARIPFLSFETVSSSPCYFHTLQFGDMRFSLLPFLKWAVFLKLVIHTTQAWGFGFSSFRCLFSTTLPSLRAFWSIFRAEFAPRNALRSLTHPFKEPRLPKKMQLIFQVTSKLHFSKSNVTLIYIEIT